MSLIAKALALVGVAAVIAAADMGLRPTPILSIWHAAPAVETPPAELQQPTGEPPTGEQRTGVLPGDVLPPPPIPTPTPKPPKPSTAPATTDPFEGMAVSLEKALDHYRNGAQMIDARTEDEFKAGHIAMAFHGPADKIADVLQLVPKEMDIVIYCTGGDCHASHDVALLLKHAGYTNLFIMTDGFDAWKNAGYDVE